MLPFKLLLLLLPMMVMMMTAVVVVIVVAIIINGNEGGWLSVAVALATVCCHLDGTNTNE